MTDTTTKQTGKTGRTVILGSNTWGAGKDRDEAFGNWRRHGGKPERGYTLLTFDDETEFVGVSGFDGSVSWNGNEPTATDVPAYRDVDYEWFEAQRRRIKSLAKDEGLPTLGALLAEMLEDGGNPDKIEAIDAAKLWELWSDHLNPCTDAIQQDLS